MVYNTVANLRILVGLDTASYSDADIGVFQDIADSLITEYNSSPTTASGKIVELSLVRRLMYQGQLLKSYNKTGMPIDTMSMLANLRLTDEDKATLGGFFLGRGVAGDDSV